MLCTSHPIQHAPPPGIQFSYYQSAPLSFFLTPDLCLASLIHLCSLLPTAKKLTYGTLPWHAHLHFAD